jgi:hypothetical protein
MIYRVCNCTCKKEDGRDSSVGTKTSYGLDRHGLIPGRGEEIFLHYIASRPVLGPTQPSIQWVSASNSPRVKRPERKAEHS